MGLMDAPPQNPYLRRDFPARVFPQGREDKTRLATVGGSKFLMNGPPMAFERPGRNPQISGNDLVRHPFTSCAENFLLPLG